MSPEKITVCVSGAVGRLGTALRDFLSPYDYVEVIAIDKKDPIGSIDVNSQISKAMEKSDILVIVHKDPANVSNQAEIAAKAGKPFIVATTGLSVEVMDKLRELSKLTRAIQSNNFSLGVNAIKTIIGQLSQALHEYDIDILDDHHRTKEDAPSGTALVIAKEICSSLNLDPEESIKPGGSGFKGVRPKGIVAIASKRAGGTFGKHDISYSSPEEVVTVSHAAAGRQAFAKGIWAAILYLLKVKKPGWYTMEDDVLGLS